MPDQSDDLKGALVAILDAGPTPVTADEAMARGQSLAPQQGPQTIWLHPPTRRKAMGWIAVVAVLVVALVIGFRISSPSSKSNGASRGNQPAFAPDQPRVAVVNDGVLSLVNETTRKTVVLARGPYYGDIGSAINTPGFSFDGKWLAYIETIGVNSSLYVVPSAGGSPTIDILGGTSYSWSPTTDDLAVSVSNSVELLSATGIVLRHWSVPEAGPLIFSPSGHQIAVESYSREPIENIGSVAELSVSDQNTIFLSSGLDVCEIPAGWTADSSHLLSWQDTDCSASIAAGGLSLLSFPIRSPHPQPITLGTELVNRSWVIPVSGTTVLVNSGTGRIAFTGKTLESCNASTGVCSRVPGLGKLSGADPAIASVTKQIFDTSCSSSGGDALAAVNQIGVLWEEAPTATIAHRILTTAGCVADPVPTANGSKVTFVHLGARSSASVDVLDVKNGAVHSIASVEDDVYYGEFLASEVLAVWNPPT